ncbi:MAG: hypothetical protein ACTSYD_05550 [Candidatus Heimdallarchaeaceae archaeon]
MLFDETQKERGRIFTNFRILANDLEQAGFKIGVYDSYPIKYSSLSKADVFVFLCPDGSKLYGTEVKGLLRYVQEGGSLAIFANAGGDKGLNTNLNALLKHFDMELISNQVFDYKNFDVGFESCPLVKKIFKHPITEGVKELSYVSGCSLNIGPEVIELARTESTSDPPSATIMAVTTYGLGKIFVCGSYLMFSDRRIGISLRDNRTLAQNLFTWLAEEAIDLETVVSKRVVEPIATSGEYKDQKGRIEAPTVIAKERPSERKLVSSPASISETAKEIKSAIVKKEVPPSSETLTRDEILKSVAILRELKNEIDSLKIDDPGYKEILLTDMARRRGIDYTKILPYLETIEKKEREKQQKQAEVSEISAEISEKATFPIVDSSYIPVPTQEIQDETVVEEISAVKTEKEQIIQKPTEPQDIVSAIKSLKQSIDVMSANLVQFLGDIVLELRDLKKLLKGEKDEI